MTMTVIELITNLKAYIGNEGIKEDTPVVIRQGIGWDGFSNYGVGEIQPKIVHEDLSDDYPESRKALRKREEESTIVLTLKRDGYDHEWDENDEDDY